MSGRQFCLSLLADVASSGRVSLKSASPIAFVSIGRVKVPNVPAQAPARKIHAEWIERVEAIAPKRRDLN